MNLSPLHAVKVLVRRPEALGPWYSHGDGDPEQHGNGQLILRRR